MRDTPSVCKQTPRGARRASLYLSSLWLPLLLTEKASCKAIKHTTLAATWPQVEAAKRAMDEAQPMMRALSYPRHTLGATRKENDDDHPDRFPAFTSATRAP